MASSLNSEQDFLTWKQLGYTDKRCDLDSILCHSSPSKRYFRTFWLLKHHSWTSTESISRLKVDGRHSNNSTLFPSSPSYQSNMLRRGVFQIVWSSFQARCCKIQAAFCPWKVRI
ncbi:uncharacterized protein FMAN_14285 [Fusarium mangiferae]|uniref:Uncharacterized protein n=1 Tax=Fusarium mangiferae TaxID=192010 RepID=A0A1L7UEZ5_FUSMA|nr:uncharacterized protein FMAN_14285 [Fusarium mangiferae]CVL09009.1 uncharacterized protein FMAN_14285 [Fusarium mangiferae]